MIKRLPAVLLFVFVASCSGVSQARPTLSQPTQSQPTVAATSLPPSASAAPPATVTVQPTADPNFFRDDFAGSLAPQWSWVREDPKNWSLTALPGFLQINVGGGYVAAKTNSNLLLRPAPQGDFQIETQISFRPDDNFQFAGLIVYESAANFIQAGRGYCHSFECPGLGLYMNYYRNGVAVGPDFGQAYKEDRPVILRLSRMGNVYTFAASTDGKVWFVIGSHTSELKPLQIGLVAGQRLKGTTLPAAFDYFQVHSLP